MKLSIIVVTWNNENYIERALRSCIDEDAMNYEVIVVHNASTDRTGEMIERSIKGKERFFKVISNDENKGLGEGRNIGMAHAAGEYIAFLDGDDWYASGAVSKILTATQRQKPDILIFNHLRSFEDGRSWRNPAAHLLTTGDASSPQERSQVLGNFGVAWNKAYRARFLLDNGFKFNGRYYEDIDWNFYSLLSANSVWTIEDELVHYRQREGSITKTRSDKHFDIFSQYEDVLRFLQDRPELLSTYGTAIYRYARRQVFGVVVARSRLLPWRGRTYLWQLARHLDKWRHSLNITRFDPKLTLARLGSLTLFRAFATLAKKTKQQRSALKRVPSRVKRATVNAVYRAIYMRLPISTGRVYCESYWGAKADCNPLAIAEGLRGHGGFDVVYGFKTKDAIPANFPFRAVITGTLQYYRELATANFVVSNTNISGDIIKRPGTKHVQTWHGTPLKTMGIDIRPYNPSEMDWAAFVRRSRRWDFVISSNEHSTRAWRQGCPFDYKVIETGYPRNDILFNHSEEFRKDIRSALKIPEGKSVALYAPTFRFDEKGKTARLAGKGASPDTMAEALGSDFVLLVRAHYFSESRQFDNPSVIDASKFPRTNDLLTVVDLLITDYSSVMFDFACLKRPIVLFPYDYEEYLSSRGTYFDLTDAPPGHIYFNSEALLRGLAGRSFLDEKSNSLLDKFNAQFCPWDDGHATDRVLNKVFGIEPKESR